MTWCCPLHHGTLSPGAGVLRAECCGREFPVVEGIPDLRVSNAAWVDFDRDLQAARALAARVPRHDLPGTVRAVFARRAGWTAERIEARTTMTLALAERMRDEWTTWLAPVAAHPGPFLDLGCGAGSFLSVAPHAGARLGIDVSMEWLVVAQRMCQANGVEVHLAAALAEALPLRAGSVGALTALDVIEHVGDQAAMVREIERVLQPAGIFCAATPNRFSIAAEPHVGVWGVGWLPRSLQADYVRWRANLSYEFTRLLSQREIKALFRQNASFVPEVDPAPIPSVDRERFGWRRRLLADRYNGLLHNTRFRSVARNFGAFFHIRGIKPGLARLTTLVLTLWALGLPEWIVPLA